MTVTYFKRFRMQCDLRQHAQAESSNSKSSETTARSLPNGYALEPWDNRLLKGHANAKYQSFKNELDSNVFPCLANEDDCLKLMNEISCRQGFIPEATWLVTKTDASDGSVLNCGTVQGIRNQVEVGSIQNLGIAPEHRGSGLGSALLSASLAGFHSVGIKFVTLEVTSHNLGAIRLYERLGFQVVRTVYKSADLTYS